jgi:hypothetical protein
MEIAIPAVALGALYIISNQKKKKESFSTNNQHLNRKSMEYPIDRRIDLHQSTNRYTNPNQRSDRYNTKQTAENYYKKNCDGDEIKVPETFSSLTGNEIMTKDIEHNNMVPFFGSSVKQSTGGFDKSEGILDRMTGAGSQKIKKGEIAPLFKPKPDIGWGHGMPSFTDFIQSRQNPSKKMSNTKMFVSQMVGPGLNNGYNGQPSGGFNSGMEAREKWMPQPSVTQRTTTHQGTFLGGVSPVTNRGIQGNVEKNSPDTFYVNSSDRYFTTTGQEKRQRGRSTEVFRPENRPTTTKEYFGSGVHETDGPTMRGNYRQSQKPIGKPFEMTAAYAPGKDANTGEYGKEGYKNRPNERQLTSENGWLGGASSVVTALVAPITDMLRHTRKSNVVGNKRGMGNATGPELYPAYNPADRTRTTMKETTETNKYPMFMNRESMQSGGGYHSNAQQATHTQRQTTNYSEFGTPGGTASSSNAKLYDAAYNADINRNKEKLLQTRKPSGNMALVQNNQNLCVKKNDCDRVNHRGFAPQKIANMGGTKDTQGRMSGRRSLKSDLNCSRNEAGILKAFNSNPYTQSLNSVA